MLLSILMNQRRIYTLHQYQSSMTANAIAYQPETSWVIDRITHCIKICSGPRSEPLGTLNAATESVMPSIYQPRNTDCNNRLQMRNRIYKKHLAYIRYTAAPLHCKQADRAIQACGTTSVFHPAELQLQAVFLLSVRLLYRR